MFHQEAKYVLHITDIVILRCATAVDALDDLAASITMTDALVASGGVLLVSTLSLLCLSLDTQSSQIRQS